ncbi:hypothetical protein [Ktedonobacter sp. SOSP1-52]|uniref:hypothetical protein n=1 Tax=Ktedonobacter sp. SOSP1-52 TaxID=2778366 RepID=UPI0019150E40|nr:hypothetical protein [Ktedonobacter sp. SOSP1-52]
MSDQQRKNAHRLITWGRGSLITGSLMIVAMLWVGPYLNLSWLGILAVPIVLALVLLIIGLCFTLLGNRSLRHV